MQSSTLNSCWQSPGLLTSSYRAELKPAEAMGVLPLISWSSGSPLPLSHICRQISELLYPSSSHIRVLLCLCVAKIVFLFKEEIWIDYLLYVITIINKKTNPLLCDWKGLRRNLFTSYLLATSPLQQ